MTLSRWGYLRLGVRKERKFKKLMALAKNFITKIMASRAACHAKACVERNHCQAKTVTSKNMLEKSGHVQNNMQAQDGEQVEPSMSQACLKVCLFAKGVC